LEFRDQGQFVEEERERHIPARCFVRSSKTLRGWTPETKAAYNTDLP